MRSIWKGSISFGLVNVPTSIYSATQNHDLSLHQVHAKDGGRIRYQRRCEVCGEVVEWADIQKAYEEDGRSVVITDEDLESLPTEKSREIQILQFVPSEQIDPIMLDKSYYLAPAATGTKPYVLLRRTLEETERTAVVSFTLRQKTRLGALRVRDGVLVLQSMLWDDEIRKPEFPELDTDVRITDMELDMSSKLVESYSADFHPEEFTDDYQEQLRALVANKLEKGEDVSGEETFSAQESEGDAEVVDLMEALRRSVSQSKKQTGGGTTKSSGGGTGEKPASRKPASKKPAADGKTTDEKTDEKKTAAAKKSATKKPATKKPASKQPATKKAAPAKPTAKKEPAARSTKSGGKQGAKKEPAARAKKSA